MGISFASDLLRNKEGSDIAYIEQIQRMEPLKKLQLQKQQRQPEMEKNSRMKRMQLSGRQMGILRKSSI